MITINDGSGEIVLRFHRSPTTVVSNGKNNDNNKNRKYLVDVVVYSMPRFRGTNSKTYKQSTSSSFSLITLMGVIIR